VGGCKQNIKDSPTRDTDPINNEIDNPTNHAREDHETMVTTMGIQAVITGGYLQ
jgi:hypothetical protein